MISIVIPTLQEERYIAATLRRIRNTLSLPHEIIVSDDDSSDGTVDIAKSLADTVVTYDGTRRSPARTRNAGARVARNEFILFLDADCRMPDIDSALANTLPLFHADPSLVGLAGAQWVWPEAETWRDRMVFGIDNIQNRLINNVFHRGWANGKCMLVRRKAFEHVGGFDENIVFGEDWNLFMRLAKIGKTRYTSLLASYHSGRRLHALGVIRFYAAWIFNGLNVLVFNKAYVDEWKPVR